MKNELLLLSVLLVGCGSSFTGTYKGPEDVSSTTNGDFTNTLTVKLTQDGSNLEGTWVSSSGDSGTASGVADGDTIDDLLIDDETCDGVFVGTAKLDGDTLSGSFAGTSTNCGTVAATFELEKQ